MKALRLLVLALVLFSRNASANEAFKIDPADSTIAFKLRHMLGTARGKFTKFSGTIEANPDRPEQSSVAVTIGAASIDTGIAKRDEHLRGELFNVAKYPDITFKSRRVKQTGPDAGEILGDLMMHGVARPITLNVKLLSGSDSVRGGGVTRWRVTTTPLKRSEFGLVFSKSAETVSMIGDDVTVEIEIAATRAK